jgi:hypothetical protein
VTLPDWREAAIAKLHDRAAFDCGEPALNEFLKAQARQAHERGASKTFVAAPVAEPKTVLGFYSLSPASLEFDRAPDVIRRASGRYEVPGFRLGRLATCLTVQGWGLGGQLLICAARRCLAAAEEVGGTVLFIDAKSERTAQWYERYGALRLADAPRSLVIALETLAPLVK